MGRERRGKRQYLCLCAAGLIMVMLVSCYPPYRTMTVEQEKSAPLQEVHPLMEQGDFESALRESEDVFAHSPQGPPGDAALFKLGLIHLHYANPEKDYQKALGFFSRLAQEFPDSPRTEEARVWLGLLESVQGMAEQQRSEGYLQGMQELLAQGDFDGALRKNQQVLALHPQSPPGDTALFNMGLIHVHYANPRRDIGKALGFFAQLAKEFPGSQRGEEAKIWAGILETLERTRQIDIDIEMKQRVLRN
jgi:TolA-binding protein